MLVTSLTGNIGDHLTRYALCRAVAEKNGYKWGINKVTSHDYYSGKEQMFFLDIDYGEPNNTPYGQMPEGITNIWEEKREHYDTHDFYPFQPDIFDVKDNTKLVIFCGQDARYLNRDKVKEYIKFRQECVPQCEQVLKNNNIELDENLTVMNIRGGEYRGIKDLFLPKKYFNDAMGIMLDTNPRMKFIVITDDPDYFRQFFNMPVHHFDIMTDYYIINHARNLILSNSAFGIFPTWTNENVNNVVAPKHWARHNLGIWASSSIWTFGEEQRWKFIDREGKLS
jgi:hypothetical protein